MNERNTHAKRIWWMATIAFLLFTATAVLPVAAGDWPDYQKIYIKTENGIRFDKLSDGTYYFKLEGSGLNSLHITNDPKNITSGQYTKTTSQSGTFWMTDTGGRGFDDDAILLIGVNGTPDSNFKVHITSSGYNWTPTGALNQIPAENAVTYDTSAVNNVEFTEANFTTIGSMIISDWRPSTSSFFPVFSGQNMDDSTLNNFKFIPVDLKVGILGTGINTTFSHNLTDYGAARIDYSIEGIPTNGIVAFNGYAWCNQSNQQQGVSWTNNVNTSAQGPSSSYSGWLVDP